MKIAYISPGAAGMYCGTCIHNNTLARGLMQRGHEVALVPTYTPIRTDEDNVAIDRIFFGAINVYLQQKSWLFRHTPRLVDWLLDRPRLLGFVSRFSASTDARELGELTVSMLEGEHGHQKKELDHLVEWLRDEYQPDLVHLSLSLFLGFAKRIKEALGVPVVCSLQGEDLFFDNLVEPYRGRVLALVRERTADVDAFTAPCRTYADFMSANYGYPRERLHVTPYGIDAGDLRARQHHDGNHQEGEIVVGYLARVSPEKGFHLLVDAFRQLAGELGRERVRLRAAGWLGEKDRPFYEEQVRSLEQAGLGDRFEYVGEVDRAGKVAFLDTVDVFSVPTVYREPKGLSALEAMAAGLPVVQPAHGVFPEMLAAAPGGLLVEARSVPALARGLRELVEAPARRRELGAAGRAGVLEKYRSEVEVEALVEVYRATLSRVV